MSYVDLCDLCEAWELRILLKVWEAANLKPYIPGRMGICVINDGKIITKQDQTRPDVPSLDVLAEKAIEELEANGYTFEAFTSD